jgi:meso-butanediol dehydrogenase / (S,S)-butanediol dehydrogenase / diacetyl reductase
MRLKDQVAIITGGASGIGEATSRLFALQEAIVVIADLSADRTEALVDELKKQGGQAIGVCCDVSQETQVRQLIEKTIDTFGKLDILFNNAGTILPKAIDQVQEEEWDRLFAINVKSMFYTIKHSLDYLKQTKGRIVNMGSMTGVMGQRNNPAYSATKGAVHALTKALALDYAPYGVRINAICPAGVNTPLLERWISQQSDPKKARQNQDRSHMLGWTASADEIAQVALFLASNESSFVTGVIMPVEGGATLGYAAGPKPEWNYVNL